MSEEKKVPTVVFGPAHRITASLTYVTRVLRAIGVQAWVSDKSKISDFSPVWEEDMSDDAAMFNLSEKLGVEVFLDDYVYEVAERIKAAETDARTSDARHQLALAAAVSLGVVVAFALCSLCFNQ